LANPAATVAVRRIAVVTLLAALNDAVAAGSPARSVHAACISGRTRVEVDDNRASAAISAGRRSPVAVPPATVDDLGFGARAYRKQSQREVRETTWTLGTSEVHHFKAPCPLGVSARLPENRAAGGAKDDSTSRRYDLGRKCVAKAT
jgi:hypothetical protein